MLYPRVSTLKSLDDWRRRMAELQIDLDADEQVEIGSDSLLASPLQLGAITIGNRFCILPMEGWDGELDGRPTELTRRRWRNFGLSGAKLIWGGEAVAVRHDGRANPNQLLMSEANLGAIAGLRTELVEEHERVFGDSSDLLVGLQLTHSGRFARPNIKTQPEPRVIYRHPQLDSRVSVTDAHVLSDDDLRRLIDDFVSAAKRAARAGFAFVDIKHCHGYLGHETLSAFRRAGPFGGDFENRTRFLRSIIEGVQAEAPELILAVRVSIFDFAPFSAPPGSVGQPEVATGAYQDAFGGDGSGLGYELTEPVALMHRLHEYGVRLVCSTVGSPYYNPHIQRPAIFPPSDGYQPPEDPLVGVARQIQATAELKRRCPSDMIVVGSGYTYLQEWIPHVGQRAIREGNVDSIGLGRMVLSYPDLPADVLAGRPLQRKRVCRTFSDCTTAPRNGLISGCFPLDPFYKAMPERDELQRIKKKLSAD